MFAAPMIATTKNADSELTLLLEEGGRHAAAAIASPFAVTFDALGSIELPPGALHADLGPVAPQLHDFWRNRNNRVSREERLAFFGRLFGASYGAQSADGANNHFEPLMLDLCESLYQLGDGIYRNPHGGISRQTRIRTGARNLLNNLVSAGGGATPFMAGEIMAGLKTALGILKQPHLQAVFGARDIWGVVSRTTRKPYLNQFNFWQAGPGRNITGGKREGALFGKIDTMLQLLKQVSTFYGALYMLTLIWFGPEL